MRASEDLVRKHYVGKKVGIKLRFRGFHTVTRDITLPEATNDPVAIRRAASECLKRVKMDKRIWLLGVKMSTLAKVDEAAVPRSQQAALFDFS